MTHFALKNIRVNEGYRYLTPHDPVLPLARASLHVVESQVGDLEEQRVLHSLRAFYILHLCHGDGKKQSLIVLNITIYCSVLCFQARKLKITETKCARQVQGMHELFQSR